MPSDDELARRAREAVSKPGWMPEGTWARVKQLAALEGKAGFDEPIWFQFVYNHVLNKQRDLARRNGWSDTELSRRVYEAWIDKLISRPPRGWSGFESARAITEWRFAREALPGPAVDAIERYWSAWMMPDRPTARREFRRGHPAHEGGLVHPMADDPRIGGKGNPEPHKGRFDSYVAATGDWRGNKSFFRSGFCYDMSTQNFNFTATSGALLAGAMLGAERAVADGRHGLEHFPLRLWSWSNGSTQEHVDHYYFTVTLKGAKALVDHAPTPFDKLMARNVLEKQMEELVSSYHPGLKRFVAGSSRSNLQHLLGTQDGLQFIAHTMSERGALLDLGTKKVAEGMPTWGHETPAHQVAMQTLDGPWADGWQADAFDAKPIPYRAIHRSGKTWRACYMGESFGLASKSDGTGRFSVGCV
ncbi:MAG: hypothetical protein ACYTKD_27475 [Planctomycetota bacterium]